MTLPPACLPTCWQHGDTTTIFGHKPLSSCHARNLIMGVAYSPDRPTGRILVAYFCSHLRRWKLNQACNPKRCCLPTILKHILGFSEEGSECCGSLGGMEGGREGLRTCVKSNSFKAHLSVRTLTLIGFGLVASCAAARHTGSCPSWWGTFGVD